MSYLFLAIPPYSGSTLCHSLLETCPDVVPLKIPKYMTRSNRFPMINKGGFIEGTMCLQNDTVNRDYPAGLFTDPYNRVQNLRAKGLFNWPAIKRDWEESWAESNPYGTIKLQKSPMEVYYLQNVHEQFQDLKWILSLKNPYHFLTSIIARENAVFNFLWHLKTMCLNVTQTFAIQLENKAFLGDQAYVYTYEDFLANMDYHRQRLGEWLPGLEQMNISGEIKVKGNVSSIENREEEKFQKLLFENPTLLTEINKYFIPHEKIFNDWGYEIRTK